MKKKWLYLLLIVVLVIPILYFYTAFNGNPIWKIASTHSLNQYLEETYPRDGFNVKEGFYNFKINGYTYQVVKIGEGGQGYEFQVTGFMKPAVTYDGIYYANLDLPLMEKLQSEAAAEIAGVLNMDNLIAITVQVEVLKGTYSADTSWKKELKLEKPISIHVTMDVVGMNKEDTLSAVQTIKKKLDEAGYSYERVSFNGNLFDEKFGGNDHAGYLKYAARFEPDSQITLKDIEEYNQ